MQACLLFAGEKHLIELVIFAYRTIAANKGPFDKHAREPVKKSFRCYNL